MADLEDFFAKRDKKKKTKKFESVDIDGVAKVLEEKARERKKAEQYQHPPSAVTESGAEQGTATTPSPDEEWKEVEELEPDLTGLKIQEFKMEDEEREEREAAEQSKEKVEGGPWGVRRVKATPPVPAAALKVEEAAADTGDTGEEPAEEPTEPPTEVGQEDSTAKKYLTPAQKKRLAEEGTAKTPATSPAAAAPPQLPSSAGGKYVPPSQRAGAGGGPPKPTPRRSAAPNIQSEEYFPSLGAATPSKS